MSEPYVDSSELHEVVESLLHERDCEQLPPPDYAISTIVSAVFTLYGWFPLLDSTELDRWLTRRDRITWLAGGEYQETILTYNRITGDFDVNSTTYSPSEAAYLAAVVSAPDFDGFTTLVTDHSLETWSNGGPPLYSLEVWLTDINTFESACATCSELLATPNIDAYEIGSGIDVRYVGSVVTLTEDIANWGDTPHYLLDQGGAVNAEFVYTLGGFPVIQMRRVKAEMTGPVCHVTTRIQNPTGPGEFVETVPHCVPFNLSEDSVLIVYIEPPCQRGRDFWYENVYQRRNSSEDLCSGTSEVGAAPDCSAS